MNQQAGIRGFSRGLYTLITGGCGFIGTNLADRLLGEGERVCVFDNLSRAGTAANLEWLRRTHGGRLEVVIADVRDMQAVRSAVKSARRVFHFAAQVAVTTSLTDPLEDFEINARGTLNVLESVRNCAHRPPLLFTSTNKVYGGLDGIRFAITDGRYTPRSVRLASRGIDERRPLDFQSPYGCSKGAADQYVRDYARICGVSSIVFRMSCIYGPHQCGTEDQGWIAHFLIRALRRQAITIYGDGKQVRDILFVDDLVEALLLASANSDRLAGRVFNIGGGLENAISLLDLVDIIERADRCKLQLGWESWRAGDQKYYVSDTSRFRRMTGWRPRVAARAGIARLRRWLIDNEGSARPEPGIFFNQVGKSRPPSLLQQEGLSASPPDNSRLSILHLCE
jgi:CDP-paratose 2-epimerase